LGESVFYSILVLCNVQVPAATAFVACIIGRSSSKSKHSSAKAETEAEYEQSRPR